MRTETICGEHEKEKTPVPESKILELIAAFRNSGLSVALQLAIIDLLLSWPTS